MVGMAFLLSQILDRGFDAPTHAMLVDKAQQEIHVKNAKAEIRDSRNAIPTSFLDAARAVCVTAPGFIWGRILVWRGWLVVSGFPWWRALRRFRRGGWWWRGWRRPGGGGR